jgi:hypothetical protein
MQSIIIIHHPGDDGYEEGWYIVFLDPDGTAWDAIGAFDTEDEAIRILEENSTE